ncbi:MAG: SDR family NAD(P)-dependent oxidoreductase [Alphaproteobacteria bacterium]
MNGFDFTGRQVLVTGASRGIGLGVAKGFLEAGAELTILSSGNEIEEVARDLSKKHDRPVTGLVCDITERETVAATVGRLKQIDILINNAGLELITPIDAEGREVEETFRRIIDINVMGTYYVTREAIPKMRDGGRIIITSSMWGKTAVAEFSAYCASKHANIGFMRSLAQELAPRGISVNAVCPGWVCTTASMRSLSEMAKRENRSEDDLLAEIVGAQAIDGLMEPEDMAATYLFLASDAANNITGQAFTVDRGETMQ